MRSHTQLGLATACVSVLFLQQKVSAQEEGEIFTAPVTTITNADGSSFTALVQLVTDTAGGVSTTTFTIDAVAGGEPEPTLIAEPLKHLEGGDILTVPITTITNLDGSSFTALLEEVTDATGGVSTMTVTVDDIGFGQPETTQMTNPDPTAATTANLPEEGATLVVPLITVTKADGSSFTALLEPITDSTGGVSTLTVIVDAIGGGVPEPTAVLPPISSMVNAGNGPHPSSSVVTSTARDGSVVVVPVKTDGDENGGGGGAAAGGSSPPPPPPPGTEIGGDKDKADDRPDEEDVDNTSECATQTATFCLDSCTTVSGSLSCSATCTATSTGCDITGTTATTTLSCSSQVCQTAVLTTLGGGPPSSIMICPDCEATTTSTGPISTAMNNVPARSPIRELPNDLIFTITFVTDFILDTPSFEVDTAAANAAMHSIDLQQLSLYPGGVLTLTTTATFDDPAGPLTVPEFPDGSSTVPPPPPPAITSSVAPAPVDPEMPPPRQLSSDCPQSACTSEQTPICAPSGKCLCGSSSLNLGPIGAKFRRSHPSFLPRFRRG
ncbi:hypothetical protein DL98DRAFT_614725 [Cadophora sp. DSE1049]|nr:hypothetical protein DL98DRAFT_614725 [Cadophora sp. DSE1049]